MKKEEKDPRKQRKTKLDDREQLKERHECRFSGPQLRLWARMIVAKTYDNMDDPPKVPMTTGVVQKSQPKESLTEAFIGAATAIAKVLSPASAATGATAAESQRVSQTFSSGKSSI